MSKTEIFLGILMFALATAFLYVWGLKKSVNSREDLNKRLKAVCGAKVVKYLKKNKSITASETAKLIEGTAVGFVWSKNKAKVQNGNIFSREVLQYLKEQMYITEDSGVYRLKEK